MNDFDNVKLENLVELAIKNSDRIIEYKLKLKCFQTNTTRNFSLRIYSYV